MMEDGHRFRLKYKHSILPMCFADRGFIRDIDFRKTDPLFNQTKSPGCAGAFDTRKLSVSVIGSGSTAGSC